MIPNHRLIAAMTAAGVTQAELSRRLQVNKSAVSHWVTGRRALSLVQVQRVATELGVRPEQLAFDDTQLAPTQRVTSRRKGPGSVRAGAGSPGRRKAVVGQG